MSKVTVLGIRYDDLPPEDAVQQVFSENCPTQTVTASTALIAKACAENPDYLRLMNRSSVILPEGAGIRMAAKRQGTPMVYRQSGIEFCERLLEECAKRGERVFLLGGRDGTADRAAQHLMKLFQGLRICGCFWGQFDRFGEDNRRVLSIINSCKPSVLLVGLGFPVQEEWIQENAVYLPSVKIAVGVGGNLAIWAGEEHRAPRAVRAADLEWAWNLFKRPVRLRNLPGLLRYRSMCAKNAKNYRRLHMNRNENPTPLRQTLQK